MSQLSTDVRTFGGILSDLFDGKSNLEQTGARFAALGGVISGQIKTDLTSAGKAVVAVEGALGPQATAAIATGLQDAEQAGAAALSILDADAQPYMAGATKAVEGAVDSIVGVLVPGGAVVINPLINGGLDAIASALKGAIDAQVAARKAQLLTMAVPGAPAPAPAPVAA